MAKSPKKPWLGIGLGVGIFGLLGFALWRNYRGTLNGPQLTMHMVDGKRWRRTYSPAMAGHQPITCLTGIPGLHCWTSQEARERIPGGKAAGRSPREFDHKQLKIGTNVEMEHTDDPMIAREIAMDHLTEDPAYYTKLAKIHLDD